MKSVHSCFVILLGVCLIVMVKKCGNFRNRVSAFFVRSYLFWGLRIFYFRGMRMKTVTFCGNIGVDYASQRKAKSRLYNAISYLAKTDTYNFLVGGYGLFNALCVQTLEELRHIYPNINIDIQLPHTNPYDTSLYDFSYYYNGNNEDKIPREVLDEFNKCMIEKSNIVICCYVNISDITIKMYNYALIKKKEIIKLSTEIK